MLLYLVGNNVYPSTWAFFTTARFHWPPYLIGLSLTATGVGMVFTQMVLTGRLVARFGERNAAMFGLAFAAANCVAYISVPYAWMVFPISLIGGLQAIAYPALTALATHQVPETRQGELQGALSSLSSIAMIFGPSLMTQTLAHFTAPGAHPYFPGAAFVLAGTLNLCALLLLIVQTRRIRARAAAIAAD